MTRYVLIYIVTTQLTCCICLLKQLYLLSIIFDEQAASITKKSQYDLSTGLRILNPFKIYPTSKKKVSKMSISIGFVVRKLYLGYINRWHSFQYAIGATLVLMLQLQSLHYLLVNQFAIKFHFDNYFPKV